MVEVATLEASAFVAAAVLPPSLLLPVSVNPKCLSLVRSHSYDFEHVCEWNGLTTGLWKRDSLREMWGG